MKIKITAGTAALEDIYICRIAALEMTGKTFKVERIDAPNEYYVRLASGSLYYVHRLASGSLYYVHPGMFEIVEPPKKIKITATAEKLRERGVASSEADRLTGTIQKVVSFEEGSYAVKAKPGIGNPTSGCWWIRAELALPLLDEESDDDEVAKLDLTKPVQTRSGSPVKVLMVVPDSGILYPVVGLIEGASMPTFWNRDGINYTAKDACNELINVPPAKQVQWINVYRDSSPCAHATREEADRAVDIEADRIACVKVTEGDGL